MVTRAEDNPFPSVLLVEQDETTIGEALPATAHRRLVVGLDHLLYLVDDTGTPTLVGGGGSVADILDIPTAETDGTLVLAPDGAGGVEFRAEAGGSGGGGVIASAVARRTSGNITVSATTPTAIDTGLDLVLDAAAGDLVECWVDCLWGNATAQSVLTAATVVSGSVVNYLSTGTSTPVAVWGWSKSDPGVAYTAGAGTIAYVLQSGDIAAGQVTLRLMGNVGSGSITLFAGSSEPFRWGAKVLRP